MSWLDRARLELITAETLPMVIDECLEPNDGLLGFDTEQLTANVHRDRDTTICIQLARASLTAYVLPIRFDNFDGNIPIEVVRQQMQRIWDAALAGKLKLCGSNIGFDLDATHTLHQRYFPAHAIEDSILKGWVADPGGARYGRAFGLKSQALTRLGREMMEFDEVAETEPTKHPHPRIAGLFKRWPVMHFERCDPTARATLEYAGGDAISSRDLSAAIKLSPDNQIIYECELTTAENVRRYRAHGHYIDIARASALHAERIATIETNQERLRELTNPEAKSTPAEVSIYLATALARGQTGKLKQRKTKRKVPLPDGKARVEESTTTFIQYCTSREALEAVIDSAESTPVEVEIARAVLAQRSPQHDITTYLRGLLSVPPDQRMHFDVRTFGQITARFSGTGRGSIRVPWPVNVLTIPRDKAIRQCFAAPPGYWYVQLDFASEEPRLLANLSGDARLIAMFRDNLDFHRRTASILFNKRPEDVTPAERNIGKPEGLATLYGQSAFTLAEKHDQTLEWAVSCIQQIEGLYPQAIAWRKQQVLQSLLSGSNVSAYGRRIPRDRFSQQGVFGSSHKDAPNGTIQTTGADLLRIAIAVTLRWLEKLAPGAALISTVHDSLDLHVLPEHIQLLPKLCKAIERAVTRPEWQVPMVVDCKIGHTWGQLYDYGKTQRGSFPGDILHPDERQVGTNIACDNLRHLYLVGA